MVIFINVNPSGHAGGTRGISSWAAALVSPLSGMFSPSHFSVFFTDKVPRLLSIYTCVNLSSLSAEKTRKSQKKVGQKQCLEYQ